MHFLWVKAEGLAALGSTGGCSGWPAQCPAAPHSWLKHASPSHPVTGNAPVAGTPPAAHPGGSQPFTHGQAWPQRGVLLLAVMFWRSQTGIVYKEPAEICKDSAVRCDGVVDCSQRSDELGCGEAPRAGMVGMRGAPGAPLTLLSIPQCASRPRSPCSTSTPALRASGCRCAAVTGTSPSPGKPAGSWDFRSNSWRMGCSAQVLGPWLRAGSAVLFPPVLCFPAGRWHVQRCSGHNAGAKWPVLGGGPSLPVLTACPLPSQCITDRVHPPACLWQEPHGD